MPLLDIDAFIDASITHNLPHEIHQVLSSAPLSFSGTFYHASALSNPPNPCLTVDGLGILGLPLGERDARAIIAFSTASAQSNLGEETASDRNSQEAWEIEASNISFSNPAWNEYVDDTLCTMLCESLGVIVSPTSRPKMELRSLFLCGTGSQFLSHQHTAQAEGAFARATILLPSAYTGGKVTLSHAGKDKTIEVAQQSLLSTSLIAWYTEIKPKVEPISSGFCLGLSYNLIHPSQQNEPHPGLPDPTESTNQLRRIFSEWMDREKPLRYIAYLLDHHYPSDVLVQGLNVLKGVDLHRVTIICGIADQLGFRVCLASLDHQIRGLVDGDGEKYYKTPRYRVQDESAEKRIPKLKKVLSTVSTISSLVNLEDLCVLSVAKIKVEENCLTPHNPFNSNQPPDEAKYHGDCELHYWYHKTCVVLMRKKDVDHILYRSEGPPYVIRMLKKSPIIPPRSYHRQWVDILLQKSTKPIAEEDIFTLLDFSFQWKDVKIWDSIFNNQSFKWAMMRFEMLKKSMEIFGFNALRSSLENVLQRSTDFSAKIQFLIQLPSNSPESQKEMVNDWSRAEIKKIIASYTSLKIKDIPSIICSFELEDFTQTLIPNLEKMEQSYAFCIALVKALLQSLQTAVPLETEVSRDAPLRTASLSVSDAEDQSSFVPVLKDHAGLTVLIKQCLRLALPQWKEPRRSKIYSIFWDTKNDSIMEIMELALELPDFDICKALFINILEYHKTHKDEFKNICIPLMPRLRTLLEAKEKKISSDPFLGFTQVVIGLYLRDILGKRGDLPNVNLRKIGCGCDDCSKLLDNYLFDHHRDLFIIEVPKARRLHLEHRLRNATDLCTYKTVSGRPYGVYVEKLPAVIEASEWVFKQKHAKKFLASIGSDNDISRIMGTRYIDVKNALDGSRSFGSVLTNAPSLSTTAGAGSASTDPVASTVKASTASTTTLAQGSIQDQVNPVENVPPVVQRTSAIAGVPRHASETDFSQRDTDKRRRL